MFCFHLRVVFFFFFSFIFGFKKFICFMLFLLFSIIIIFLYNEFLKNVCVFFSIFGCFFQFHILSVLNLFLKMFQFPLFFLSLPMVYVMFIFSMSFICIFYVICFFSHY
jgi:hypothetical protein